MKEIAFPSNHLNKNGIYSWQEIWTSFKKWIFAKYMKISKIFICHNLLSTSIKWSSFSTAGVSAAAAAQMQETTPTGSSSEREGGEQRRTVVHFLHCINYPGLTHNPWVSIPVPLYQWERVIQVTHKVPAQCLLSRPRRSSQIRDGRPCFSTPCVCVWTWLWSSHSRSESRGRAPPGSGGGVWWDGAGQGRGGRGQGSSEGPVLLQVSCVAGAHHQPARVEMEALSRRGVLQELLLNATQQTTHGFNKNSGAEKNRMRLNLNGGRQRLPAFNAICP